MGTQTPSSFTQDLPNATATRRFWTAWFAFLLAILLGFIIIILVAALSADPALISPAG